MTSSQDRGRRAIDAELAATEADLAESEQVIADLRDGHLSPDAEPSLQLLRVAAGPATAAELEDRVGFATLVASRAVLPPVAPPEPVAEQHRSRVGLLGRILATKAAVVAAVTVLGIAGAGAATGLAVAVRSSSATTTTTVVPPPIDPLPLAGEAASGVRSATWIDDEAGPNPIVGDPEVRCAHAHTASGRLGVDLAASRAALTPAEYCDGFPTGTAGRTTEQSSTTPTGPNVVPGEDGTGAAPEAPGSDAPGPNEPGSNNGNGPDAGGNPNPGGDNPNAGGNPNPGGNNPNAGGNPNPGDNNPNPGGNGSTKGNNPNAGGNPNPGSNGNGATTGGNGSNNGNGSNAGGNAPSGGRSNGNGGTAKGSNGKGANAANHPNRPVRAADTDA